MKTLKYYEEYLGKVTIGIDIDGTISNFGEAYNALYKKYFPDKEVHPVDEWFWYNKMDYNGEKPNDWFNAKKAEIFDIAQPYPDAIVTINNIYDFVKSQGNDLKIVTNQPTEDSKQAAKIWLEKYGFKYDDIVFVETTRDKWKFADIMVDDAPKVLDTKPLSKVSIKVEQLWNTESFGDFTIPNIKGLTISLVKEAIEKLK